MTRDMSERASIVVLGAVNQDEVARVARHPLPGETVVTESIEFFPGGKGANQAYAAAAAGRPVDVRIAAAVGDDAAGKAALTSLASVGVDTSLVRTVVGVRTGRAYVAVSPDGQNSIIVGLGANAFMSPSALPPVITADVCVAQTEIGAASVRRLAQLSMEAGARFILNNGPAISLDADTLRTADPLIVNEFEAADLVGERIDNPMKLAAQVRELTEAKSVIVTLGGRGSVIADEDAPRLHQAVLAPQVVDTTGAGDTFVGVFAAAVAAGDDNDTAIRRGAEAAALAVSWHGARPPARP